MSGKNDKPLLENSDSGLTRREWLLRLGEFTALAGVAGLAPPLTLSLSLPEQQAAAALPPGLYEPSPRHLMHALSAQGAPTIPPGSETDYVQPRQGPYGPQFFSPDEFRVVTRLVEILLGKVDAAALETAEWVDLRFQSAAGVRAAARRLDPLHRALAVAYYGEAHVVELETSDPQAIARAGMAALDERAQQFGHPFLKLLPSEQADVVSAMSQQPEATPLRRFCDLLRRETIHGYYTSRAGLKELDYKGNSYYSQCPGCEKK